MNTVVKFVRGGFLEGYSRVFLFMLVAFAFPFLDAAHSDFWMWMGSYKGIPTYAVLAMVSFVIAMGYLLAEYRADKLGLHPLVVEKHTHVLSTNNPYEKLFEFLGKWYILGPLVIMLVIAGGMPEWRAFSTPDGKGDQNSLVFAYLYAIGILTVAAVLLASVIWFVLSNTTPKYQLLLAVYLFGLGGVAILSSYFLYGHIDNFKQYYAMKGVVSAMSITLMLIAIVGYIIHKNRITREEA